MGRYFGTDGVRGIANTELTPELAFRLGRAGAYILAEEHPRPTIVVGKDTRISGDLLESALIAGILSVGADVLKVGVVSTPAVAYLTNTLDAEAGVVISASHNPVRDNGIKFFSRDGFKLPDDVEDRIEELLVAEEDCLPRPTGDGVGRVSDLPDAVERYVSYLASTVEADLKGLKVVLDCAHGAAHRIAPELFIQLGATVIALNNQPTGTNINVECGSTYPQVLRQAVVQHHADIGLAFDGDADRVMAVDERGELVDGDFIMAILAAQMKAEGRLPKETLVVTVMSNLGLVVAMRKLGINLVTTKVGDRYVLEAMRRDDLILGGEQSGHVIMLDHNTTGDGILTGLHLAVACHRQGKTLSTLASVMQRFPQVLTNVKVSDRDLVMNDDNVKSAIAKAEHELGDTGRILVRPSGTEAIVRVMVEAQDHDSAHEIADRVARVIKTLYKA